MESAAACPSCCFRAQRNNNIKSGAAVRRRSGYRGAQQQQQQHGYSYYRQAGCTGGVPEDFVPITESSWNVSDDGVVERLVDPKKMDSLKQDKTDTGLKSNHSLANIGYQPVIDQPTGSLQIPSSPAPVPPPDGTLCIYRRAWSNLERPPRPPPPPPACSRSSSCQLVD